MRRHCRRPTPRTLALVVVCALGVGACSGSSDSPSATSSTRSAKERLQLQNDRYLRSTGWEDGQARCVSRRVTVDLEQLLSTAGSDKDPTDNPGFDEFAAAVRACIRQDDELTTTTTSR